MEAKVTPATARKKAELLAGGPVMVPADIHLPFLPSRSTAGPGAGSVAIVFSFGNTRAKKPISRNGGDFELVQSDKGHAITRGGKPFIKAVELVPTLMHAPYQAFVNIDSACTLGCKFCASPKLDRAITKGLTEEKILEMILRSSRQTGFNGVAITSGVPDSAALTVERMARIVRRVRDMLPNVPIGVEPYATRPDEIDLLKDAGANEIKLNIETFDRDIFEKICPNRDYDMILHAVNHACEVFGRNMVCSNIIYGLGESDENVLEGVKVLGNMGAVATLRALRRNEFNVSELEAALGTLQPISAERMLHLAKEEKKILRRHGLSPLRMRTMCHKCLSCDIVPFWDV